MNYGFPNFCVGCRYNYDDCPEAPVGYDPVPEGLAAHLTYYAGQFGWSNRGELCLSSAPRLLGAVVQTWT